MKRLFVTGRPATAVGEDGEEIGGENGDNDETASAGYESVDSEEANDPSLFTASAANKSSNKSDTNRGIDSLFSDDDGDDDDFSGNDDSDNDDELGYDANRWR